MVVAVEVGRAKKVTEVAEVDMLAIEIEAGVLIDSKIIIEVAEEVTKDMAVEEKDRVTIMKVQLGEMIMQLVITITRMKV